MPDHFSAAVPAVSVHELTDEGAGALVLQSRFYQIYGVHHCGTDSCRKSGDWLATNEFIIERIELQTSTNGAKGESVCALKESGEVATIFWSLKG